ncbi:MAG: hypothetical protein COB16_05545 [Rhodobacteraceae bacterium]|nr:MAG: hypothetical protein COB16_05545 [Paracoccaceae bacterium]
MSEEHHQFLSRVRRLERKHNEMSYGYTAQVRSDGLIVISPKKIQSRISARSVVLFLAAFLLFKGFLIASIGLDGYQDRLAKLQAGSMLEQGGAVIMTADPLSQMIAQEIGPILR